MVLASGLRRFVSLAAVVALLGGCQAVVPGADDSPLGRPCYVENGIGRSGGCEDGEYCVGHTCLPCPAGQQCRTGSGGDGGGGDAGRSDEGGAAGDDAGGSDGGTSVGGKGGQGGASGQGGAGEGGDGPGGSDGGDAGTGGTDGGMSGLGGTDGGMSGSSGQSAGGAGQAGATTVGGGAGTAGGTGGAGGASPTVVKLGEDCTASNVVCEGQLLCAPMSAWSINSGKYICTQACCQSTECGPPSSASVCMPTVFGGGMCLPATETTGRSPAPGAGLAGDACTKAADCRSGLCSGSRCQDLCCSDKGCGGLACTVTREPDTGLDAFMCQNAGPGLGATNASCTKDKDCVSGLCLLQIDTKLHCAQPCRRDSDCQLSCDYTSFTSYNAPVRACFTTKTGGGCAATKDCGSGEVCTVPKDAGKLFCQ